MVFGHIPVEKVPMRSQLYNLAVFSEAAYIYFIGQIRLDAGDAEARAKRWLSQMCYLCSNDSDKNVLSILPSFSTKSVKFNSIRVVWGFRVLCSTWNLLEEIHLDYDTENDLIMHPLHALECSSGEELIDTVALKHSDTKKKKSTP